MVFYINLKSIENVGNISDVQDCRKFGKFKECQRPSGNYQEYWKNVKICGSYRKTVNNVEKMSRNVKSMRVKRYDSVPKNLLW